MSSPLIPTAEVLFCVEMLFMRHLDTHSDDIQRVAADFANLCVVIVHQVDEVRRGF